MAHTPRVSVIIPTYNVAGCLTRAVDSVLAQTLKDFEIIIIDDASQDNTLVVATNLAASDSRIRLLPQPMNGGPSAARNIGIDNARGEWIAVLDADDAFASDRLLTLLEYATEAGCEVVADNLILYDHGAEKEVGRAFHWMAPHALTLDNLLDRDVYMRGNPIGWIKPFYKRDFIERHSIRYPAQYRHAEDFYFLATLLLSDANFMLLPNAGYSYTLRVGSLSRAISPFSASVPNMASIAASCDELAQRYRSQLTKRQLKGLERRKKRFLAGTELDQIVTNVRRKAFVRAGFSAIVRPRGSLLLVERIILGALKTIKRS